jgi:hypothetical protein
MSIKPIFSKEFYTSPWLFDKNAVEADDGRTVSQTGFFTKFRYTHAIVDKNNTITTVPFSFFANVKRYFTFTQNPDLSAVHTQLKNIERQIKQPGSARQRLIQEVTQEGLQGAENLKANIKTLSALFTKANQRSIANSCIMRTLFKTVTFVRTLLRFSSIKFPYRYQSVDIALFNQSVIAPSIKNNTDMIPLTYTTTIENASGFTLPQQFADDLKEPANLLRTIYFTIDNKKLGLKYDLTKKAFVLLYEGIPNLKVHKDSSLVVMEKKPDGKSTAKMLKYIVTACKQKGAWGTLSRATTKFVSSPGRLNLIPNNTYSILLSNNGKLSVTINCQT